MKGCKKIYGLVIGYAGGFMRDPMNVYQMGDFRRDLMEDHSRDPMRGRTTERRRVGLKNKYRRGHDKKGCKDANRSDSKRD